jgi:hypothetical protein
MSICFRAAHALGLQEHTNYNLKPFAVDAAAQTFKKESRTGIK